MIKTSDFQIAYKERGASMHGWVFDIHTGELIDLRIDFKKALEGVMEFYHLDKMHPDEIQSLKIPTRFKN